LGNLENIFSNNSPNIIVNQNDNIQLLKHETLMFFQKLFGDLKDSGQILSIILAFSMYSSSYYENLKDYMYERSSNDIPSLEYSNNILGQPLDSIFLNMGEDIDSHIHTLYMRLSSMTIVDLRKKFYILYKKNNKTSIEIIKFLDNLDDIKTGFIHFIIKEELNITTDTSLYTLPGLKKINEIINRLFENKYLDIQIQIQDTLKLLLENNYYKFMRLEKLKDIIIAVYFKWNEYVIGKNLYNKKILLYSGANYSPKQSNSSQYHTIKTLESTTYDLSISHTYASDGSILKLFVVDMCNVISIEMFSKYNDECEMLLYSPHSTYQIYDTLKTHIGESSNNILTFKKILLIVKNSKLNNHSGGRKNPKKIRKHIGIYQYGPKRNKLKPGYKYTGEKTITGLNIIITTPIN